MEISLYFCLIISTPIIVSIVPKLLLKDGYLMSLLPFHIGKVSEYDVFLYSNELFDPTPLDQYPVHLHDCFALANRCLAVESFTLVQHKKISRRKLYEVVSFNKHFIKKY